MLQHQLLLLLLLLASSPQLLPQVAALLVQCGSLLLVGTELMLGPLQPAGHTPVIQCIMRRHLNIDQWLPQASRCACLARLLQCGSLLLMGAQRVLGMPQPVRCMLSS